MGWLLRHNWLWALLAFLLGAAITWFLLVRREQDEARAKAEQRARRTAEAKTSVLVSASARASTGRPTAAPAGRHPDEPAGRDHHEPAGRDHPAGRDPVARATGSPPAQSVAVGPEGPVAAEPEGPAKPDEPAVDPEEPAAVEEPVAPVEEPVAVEELVAVEEPVAVEELVAVEEPAAAEVDVQAGDASVSPATKRAAFSRRMEANGFAESALFDLDATGDNTSGSDPADAEQAADVVPESAELVAPGQEDVVPAESDELPPGRYGEGSADAVPHQSPPDGFSIKAKAQSMLFHTPDSPYYGRTKPDVWFRTEADAERAGFAKYLRRPRKSPDPRN
jgi:hypothetical protein